MTPTPSSPGPDSSERIPRLEHSNGSSALAWRDPASDSDSNELVRTRAEENTTRELYARLINLLSQDGEAPPEPPRKSPLEGAMLLLKRRWLPMLVIFALSSLALSRVLKPGPPTFTAAASMLLPPVLGQGKGGPAIDDGSDTVARQYDTQAQIAIITAPRIVERAVAGLKPEDKIKGWGSDKIRTVPVEAASLTSENIIDITVSSLNLSASKNLADRVGDTYIQDTKERTAEARVKQAEIAAVQAEEVQKQLVQAQKELQDFKERNGVNSAEAAISGSEQNIQSLRQAAQAAETEARAGLGSATIANDTTLASLRQAERAARAEFDKLSADFQPTSERVVKARTAYQAAQAAAEARQNSLLSDLNNRAQTTRAQLEAARSSARSLPQIATQFNRLTANVARLETTYNTTSQRLASANLARNAYIAVPTFLRKARPTGLPITGRVQSLALSILGGLVLAALAGMLLDRSDRGVHSHEDLHNIIEAPVLGTLPALPRRSEARLTHMSTGRGRARIEAGLLEAAYKLRSRIIEEAYKNGVRSILVTSPDQGAGKSLCALNVAAALAFDGHRVLLVDTDFWNPSQHRLAEVALSPGYAEVLGQTVEVEAVMRASKVRNLWILPAGTRPANIGELVASSRNRGQIQAFEQAFDFVIIDSPPTLSLGDAHVLSGLADAVALVVADATPREEVQRAEAVLRLTGARLLGVILNGDTSRRTPAPSSPRTPDVSGDGAYGAPKLAPVERPAPPLEAHRD